MRAGALPVEPRAHDLLGLGETVRAVGNVLHAEQDVPPLDNRRVGPQVGLDYDTAEHRGVGLAGAGERLDRRDFPKREIGARHRAVAHHGARDEAAQAALHRFFGLRRNCETGLVRDRENVRSQNVTAVVHLGKKLEQAVGVEVLRQIGGDTVPHRRIAERDRARHPLLQARIWIRAHPVAHAVEPGAERRAERDLHVTLARERVSGQRDRLGDRLFPSHQRRLVGPYRDHRQHALRYLQMIRRSAGDGGRVDAVAQFADAHRHRHFPIDGFSFARREFEYLRCRLCRDAFDLCVYGCGEGLLGGVAHGELRVERVACADYWRDSRQDHEILRGLDQRVAGAEHVDAAIGDRDDTEAGQRIIERDFDRRVAGRIERDRRFPQQQRVEQLARDPPAAASARRQRL